MTAQVEEIHGYTGYMHAQDLAVPSHQTQRPAQPRYISLASWLDNPKSE